MKKQLQLEQLQLEQLLHDEQDDVLEQDEDELQDVDEDELHDEDDELEQDDEQDDEDRLEDALLIVTFIESLTAFCICVNIPLTSVVLTSESVVVYAPNDFVTTLALVPVFLYAGIKVDTAYLNTLLTILADAFVSIFSANLVESKPTDDISTDLIVADVALPSIGLLRGVV